VALDYKLTLGDNVTGDTPMLWGDIVSGTGYYYYVDENQVKTLKSCSFYFNSNAPQDYAVVTGNPVSFVGSRRDDATGTVSPILNASSHSVSIEGGSIWEYKCTFSPPYTLEGQNRVSVLVGSEAVTKSTPIYYQNTMQGASLPTWSCSTTWDSISYSTSSKVHENSPDTPYIPISGQTLTYNDLRRYIVNEYNAQNPEETITIDDLPDIDGNLPTEETTEAVEPSYDLQPFSIDYNEILGEKELESILKETQYVLDTTPAESIDFSFPETLPEASAPDAGIVSTVGKVFEMHKNIVPSELVTIWGGLAVFAILFWWITK
jgi:hypothetical protein